MDAMIVETLWEGVMQSTQQYVRVQLGRRVDRGEKGDGPPVVVSAVISVEVKEGTNLMGQPYWREVSRGNNLWNEAVLLALTMAIATPLPGPGVVVLGGQQ